MGAKSGAQWSGARGKPLPPAISVTQALEESVLDAARENAIKHREPAVECLVELFKSKATPAATRRAAARDVLEYADANKVGTPNRKAAGRAGLTIQIVNLVAGEAIEERELVKSQVQDAIDQVLELTKEQYAELEAPDELEEDYEPEEQLPVPDFEPQEAS